jgi:hypothetical protein
MYFRMELCDLPRDVIILIIQFCPYGQWFRLSKELNTLASQVISPLKCRTSENGVLIWAIKHNKILAVVSLLKDPRISLRSLQRCNTIRKSDWPERNCRNTSQGQSRQPFG